uniref:Spore germination protein GerPE n=1 Tax=Panagrellus redivivus TaxID=6233 RepID=A0A7E4WAG6_PANRE
MFSLSLNENEVEPFVAQISKDSGAMIILRIHSKKYVNIFTLSFHDMRGKPLTEVYYEDNAPNLLYNGQIIPKPTNLFRPDATNFVIFRTRKDTVDFIVGEKPVLSMSAHAAGATVMIDGLDVRNFVMVPGIEETKTQYIASKN